MNHVQNMEFRTTLKEELPDVPQSRAKVALPTQQVLTGQITQAIAAVMKEIDVVAKRGNNKFHNYKYAAMQDILQAVTPLLGKYGLVIFQHEVNHTMFDDGNVIAVKYEFEVAHESGEVWPRFLHQTGVSRCRDSKGGWDDKSLNKCHTAARKYFLLSLFQIPTGEEDDADGHENRASSKETKTYTPQKGPHLIPAGGMEMTHWARLYTGFLATASSAKELVEWDRMNDRLLDQINSKEPKVYEEIVAASQAREKTLKAKSEPPEPPEPKKPEPPKDDVSLVTEGLDDGKTVVWEDPFDSEKWIGDMNRAAELIVQTGGSHADLARLWMERASPFKKDIAPAEWDRATILMKGAKNRIAPEATTDDKYWPDLITRTEWPWK